PDEVGHEVSLSRLEERFRSYWGIPPLHIRRLRDLARDFRADVVVVSGLEVLPMIAGIEGPLRIWYAADEWVLHHVTQVRLFEPRSWNNLADAAIKGAYERAFRRRLDRAWVVSAADRVALRLVAGIPGVDILPNGVDAAYYKSDGAGEEPRTAVFWGRLDF